MNHDGPATAALEIGTLGLAFVVIGLTVVFTVVIGIVCLIQAVGRRKRRQKITGSIFDRSTRSR
jgi:Na+-transporting methylmalonyl-CoA/oxaloacetate decarboxylase gamma subunit